MTSHNKLSLTKNIPFAAPACLPAEFDGAAPRALVTGLKILEYLATCRAPETLSGLAAVLGLSSSSVYRSLRILQQRGYVTRAGATGSYERTNKLCELQSTALPHQRLLDHAQPIMRALSDNISQSCNLAVLAYPDLQVVSQEESGGSFGIHVPLGFRYDIPESAPGLAFAAFMKNSDVAHWPHGLSAVVDAHPWTSLKKAVQKTTETGFAQITNPHLPDVTDISCPIFGNGHFVAALTIPYIQTHGSPNLTWCLAALQQAAEQLNESLRGDALAA